MKKLLVNLTISKCICFVIVFCNLAFPVYQGQCFKLIPFQLVLIGFWVYGLLAHLGYFKVQVAKEDGKLIYEPNTPILQIAFCRLLELGYFLLAKRSVVNWKVFVVLVFMDAIYIAFMLLDKANYYYEIDGGDDDGTY